MENYYQSENSTRCATGCGFFGTAATMNMCSKCYRDYQLKEDQSSTVRAAVTKSLSSSSLLMVSKCENSVEAVTKVEPDVSGSTKAVNRCGCCTKKVGLVGFKCRCGYTYCVSHRYPEAHSCEYDYKLAGKESIAKANPLVVADKLQRF